MYWKGQPLSLELEPLFKCQREKYTHWCSSSTSTVVVVVAAL